MAFELGSLALRKTRATDGADQLIAAPFVDRDENLAGMDWKRNVHAAHKTFLVETYRSEREEGRLLDAPAEKPEHMSP